MLKSLLSCKVSYFMIWLFIKFCFSGKEDSMNKRNIPVGVSDFSEIRQNDYYYVDKSELILKLSSSAL